VISYIPVTPDPIDVNTAFAAIEPVASPTTTDTIVPPINTIILENDLIRFLNIKISSTTVYFENVKKFIYIGSLNILNNKFHYYTYEHMRFSYNDNILCYKNLIKND
jgi:hypothetical protein